MTAARIAYPYQARAVCIREQAELLVRFDHHRVQVRGRWGILITYPWLPLEEAPEPLIATVLFNPAPRHARSEADVRRIIFSHPLAPVEVQSMVDELAWQAGEEPS